MLHPFGMVMPGRSYSATNEYRYGFNGKENDNDISAGGQDYGLRIYDSRLGKFLSVDPLTDEYPELTPYQFASNRPIDGIDLDGAEYTRAELMDILGRAKAALGTLLSDNAIALRGASNAVVNANTLGISDKLGSWGTDNLSQYSNRREQSIYLWGRVVGDVVASLQGLAEVSGGSAAAGVGVTVSASGVGAVAGVPTAIIGGLVAGHGGGTITAAATDLGETIGQLINIGAIADASKATPEQSTNTQDKAAHGNSDKSNNTQHGYAVRDKNGQIVDQGISGQPLNKNGTSPRAQQKIREKYNNDPALSQTVEKKNIGPKNSRTARQNAKQYEQGKQNAYSRSKTNPTPGTGAPGQKRPKPKM